jgi:hypothetical protein
VTIVVATGVLLAAADTDRRSFARLSDDPECHDRRRRQRRHP